jgi:hypothetical protein
VPHIVKSTILDAPTGAVWNVLRDFNGHDRWHPAVATSAIERAQPSDKIGCVRRFKLKDGSELREQLLALSDLEQTFSYCLLDTPVPMFNYVAHVPCFRSPTAIAPSALGIAVHDPARRPGNHHANGGGADLSSRLRCHSPASEGGRMNAEENHAVTVKTLRVRRGGVGLVVRSQRALSRRRHAGHARAQRGRHLDLDRRARHRSGAVADRCASSRITIGAGVTFARILAERDLAFLHAPARSIGGPAVRNMGTVGGNLFAPSPYGDFTVALLALDATVSVQGGLGARDMPIEEFLQSRERQAGTLCFVSCTSREREAFRYRKIARIKPKGGSVITLAAHLRMSGRIVGARIALGRWHRRIRARADARLEGVRSMPRPSRPRIGRLKEHRRDNALAAPGTAARSSAFTSRACCRQE